MKKKVYALLICAMVSVNVLAGCGSSDEPVAETSTEAAEEEAAEEEAAEEETTEVDEDEESTSDDMCSDESFAALQEAYGYLVEEYDMIVEEYNNNSDIPQNDELESFLAEAKDLIEQMGEIDQASISEADAVSLGESMTTVATSLAEVAESVFN